MNEVDIWIERIAVLGKVKKSKIRKLASAMNKAVKLDNEVHHELLRSLPKDVSFRTRKDFLDPYPQFNPEILLAYSEIKLGEEEEEDVRLAIRYDGSIVLERELWTKGASTKRLSEKDKKDIKKMNETMSWIAGDKKAFCLRDIINGQQHR